MWYWEGLSEEGENIVMLNVELDGTPQDRLLGIGGSVAAGRLPFALFSRLPLTEIKLSSYSAPDTPSPYTTPDAFVVQLNDEFIVQLNDEFIVQSNEA